MWVNWSSAFINPIRAKYNPTSDRQVKTCLFWMVNTIISFLFIVYLEDEWRQWDRITNCVHSKYKILVILLSGSQAKLITFPISVSLVIIHLFCLNKFRISFPFDSPAEQICNRFLIIISSSIKPGSVNHYACSFSCYLIYDASFITRSILWIMIGLILS